MSLCEDLLLLRLLRLLYVGINIIRWVVPILLIIKLILDSYHCMLIGEGKRIKELSIKRVGAALIVFLLPIGVNLLLKMVEIGTGNSVNYPYCLSSLDNIKYYEELASKKKEITNETKISQEELLYEEALRRQAEALLELAKKSLIEDEAAIHMGKTYSLSDGELRGLCGVAKAEQGSIKGAKAEASLMANLYELLSPSSKLYGKGLYNYVRNGGWFSSAARHMSEGCPNDYLNAVRDVLVNGNRTLPLYINEHDCYNCNRGKSCDSGLRGDICTINTNGINYTSLDAIKNRSNYIRDNTQVYTIYTKSSYWVFYSFPASNSDPFGYTLSAKKRVDAMNK